MFEAPAAESAQIRGHGDRVQHLEQVRTLQEAVTNGEIPGVPRELQVLPDWHPDPLGPHQVRVDALRRLMSTHTVLRFGGQGRMMNTVAQPGRLTSRMGEGDFNSQHGTNIDPSHSADRRAHATIHEGGHEGRRQAVHRGAEPTHDPRTMELEPFLAARFREEAEVEGEALRFLIRETSDNRQVRGRPAEVYIAAYREAIARTGAELNAQGGDAVAHQLAVNALERAWPDIRTSGRGNPTYREAYTEQWHQARRAAAAP